MLALAPSRPAAIAFDGFTVDRKIGERSEHRRIQSNSGNQKFSDGSRRSRYGGRCSCRSGRRRCQGLDGFHDGHHTQDCTHGRATMDTVMTRP